MVLDPGFLDVNEIGFISIGVGLLSIAGVWLLSIFKSPKEVGVELAVAVDKLRSELSQQKHEHHTLARSNDVLANEVKHLGESVRTLAGEVKCLRDDGWRPAGPKPVSRRG